MADQMILSAKGTQIVPTATSSIGIAKSKQSNTSSISQTGTIRKASRQTQGSFKSAHDVVTDTDSPVEGQPRITHVISKSGKKALVPKLASDILKTQTPLPTSARLFGGVRSLHRPQIEAGVKAGKVTESQVTLSMPRIRSGILDQSRGATTDDVGMEDAPLPSPVGLYEIFEPITPTQPKGSIRKVNATPAAGPSGKQKQPHIPNPDEFKGLIVELNRVYVEFQLDLEQSDRKNEETFRKAEDATVQLQAQLWLINAESKNLTQTQQTVQPLIDELKRTQQIVETQLEMIRTQTGRITEEVAAIIKEVTELSVAKYLSGIKIHSKNTNRC